MKFKELNKIPVRTGNKQGVNEISLDIEKLTIDRFTNVDINLNGVTGASVSDLVGNENFNELKYGVSDRLLDEATREFTNGLMIKIDDNAIMSENIVIDFKFDESNSTLIDNIVIFAGENSKANIIIKYSSDESLVGYHNGVCRIFASKNSEVKVSKVNILGSKVNNFDSNISEVLDDAKVDFIAIDLGGENTVSSYEAILLGNGSKGDLSSVYIGTDSEKIDLNYVMTIKGQKSVANMDVKGALRDKAVKNFKGTLDFKMGAKKSKGVEEEFCMLLSDKARSRSVPLLLCEEDDVSGEHAASSGSIDENKLFYLMTRGISYDEARFLIINAAFNPIVDKISHEDIQSEILAYIKNRLA